MASDSRQTTEKLGQLVRHNPSLLRGDPAYHLHTLVKVPEMASIIWEIKRALEAGQEPLRLSGGTGEVFVMKDRRGAPLAIFKPSISAKDDMLTREFTAYLLDHNHFAGVPPIVMATFSHSLFGEGRRGTCQLFVAEGKSALEHFHNPSALPLSPQSIRRIAQLDLRLLNGDRHTTNMLVDGPNFAVPIDHQLVLPHTYTGVHLGWRHLPQSKTPFTDEEKGYIAAIDIAKDYQLVVQECGFQKGAGRLYTMATTLLQVGSVENLTPYEIAEFLHPPEGLKGAVAWKYSPFYEASQRISTDPESDWEGFFKDVKREIEGMVLHAFSQSSV